MPPTETTLPTWLRAWIVVSVLAVFGPYVVSGLRTEQLIGYLSAAAVVVTQLPQLVGLLRPVAPVLLLWACYALVVVVGGFFAGNTTPWPSGSFVAGADNALLPLASIVTFTFWVSRGGARPVVALVCWVLAWAAAANAVLAAVTTYAGLEAVPGLGRFWSAAGSDVSVALLAQQNGRFSGVFNQPAEAGIVYSLAVLAVIHLARSDERRPRWVLWTLLAASVVGGMLTISKIFVVGGLFLALVLALAQRRHRLAMVGVVLATLGSLALLGIAGLVGRWGAGVMFLLYRNSYRAGDSLLYIISAGRFGTAAGEGELTNVPAAPPPTPAPSPTPSTGASPAPSPSPSDGASPVVPSPDATTEPPPPQGLGDIVRRVLEDQPVLGVGARGLEIAYDSAWVESLVVGGVVGLVLMAAVHVALVVQWLRSRRLQDRATWLLGGAVVVLVVGASFGLPALTANRESTLLWMFLVPLVLLSPSARSRAT